MRLCGRQISRGLIRMLCLILAIDQCARAQELTSEVDPLTARAQISNVLQWIPPESEALTVISEPYWIPETPADPREQNSFIQDAYERTIGGAFPSLTRRVMSERLVELYVEATSQFRLEKQGADPVVVAERVYILVFKKPLGDIRLSLFRILRRRREEARVYDVEGNQVLEYVSRKRRSLAVSRRYWLSVPKPNVMVLTTRQEFMNRVFRKPPAAAPEAFPDQLKEWNHVSAGATVWGMRHFNDTVGEGDFSDARVLVDPQMVQQGNLGRASGFVFAIDSKARRARSVWLSCDDPVKEIVSSLFENYVSEAGRESDDEIADTFSVSIEWPAGADGLKTQAMFADWIAWFLGYAASI